MKVAVKYWATGLAAGSQCAIVSGLCGLSLLGAIDAVAAPKSAVKSKPDIAEAMVVPQGPLLVVISIGSQRLSVYDRNGRVLESQVSSGQSGHETPQGVFAIIERNREHFSNLYNDAPMPNMQRITWSGVAMHAGNLPGYAASHGCIRLPYSVSDRLFGMTKLGTRVIVAAHDATPVEITHPRLFTMRDNEPAAKMVEVAGVKSEAGLAPPMLLGASLIGPAQATAGLPGTDPFADRPAGTTRVAWAAELLKRAQQAEAVAKNATMKAVVARKEAVRATRVMLAAERARSIMAAKVSSLETSVERASNPVSAAKIEQAREAAQAKLLEQVVETDRLRAIDEERRDTADQLTRDAEEAARTRTATGALAREANRGVKPVSVFISRKTSRLYVRQGFEPLFDVPVTIADPGAPIGTHVFTALDAKPASDEMLWSAVTSVGAPANLPEASTPRSKRRGQAAAPPPSQPRLTAAAALDRIEMPDDVRQRIGSMLVPGSSLIVSDQGISHETGKGTDFIIVTR